LKNKSSILDVFDDFLSLFYPINCSCCDEPLYKHEKLICNLCYVSLPRFSNALNSKNELEKMLEGRVKFNRAFSLLNYQKGSKVQHLLHQLKYNNQPKIGILLGEWIVDEINYSDLKNSDFIIPIPLHPKKEKKRGYNQSLKIAEGLGNKLGIRVEKNALFRKVFTNTQTKKGKNERWENVKEVFGIAPDILKPNSKIILVDDVITTGSTIEACAKIINEQASIELIIVSLAFASLSN
jgi:ComF family protein